METIKALMIIEMIGRPPTHLEETFKDYVKKLSSEKGITLIHEKIHEPKKIEHKKVEKDVTEEKKEEKRPEIELFSTFAEIELESKDVTTLMRIIFNYMPSHIEIISPEQLELKNVDFNDLFNEVIRRMHEYDGIAKSMVMQNKMMKEKFQQILANLQKPIIKSEEVQESHSQINQESLHAEEALPPEEKKEEVDAKPKKSKKRKESN